MKIDYLIIGGGIAGTSAAETIRKHDPHSSIAIVSDEPHRLYSRIMLSKSGFFLGKIKEDAIWLKNIAWYENNAISLITNTKAEHFNFKKQEVTTNTNKNISYKKLLLATGSTPKQLEIKGTEKNGVHYLYTLKDAKDIMNNVQAAQSVLVIGGGFIGFEMCSMLREGGIDTTLLIHGNGFWKRTLDQKGSDIIEQAITGAGINIIKKSEIKEINGDTKVTSITTKDGKQISCQMIICGIGAHHPILSMVSPSLKTKHGILANAYLETNITNVWVAGDVAEFDDEIFGEKKQFGNWVNAQSQGNIAGLNMTGAKEKYKAVSFYTTTGFGMHIAFIGNLSQDTNTQISIDIHAKEKPSFIQTISKNGTLRGVILLNNAPKLSQYLHAITIQAHLDEI